MRCIYCVGRISVSSASSRPFSNSPRPPPCAHQCSWRLPHSLRDLSGSPWWWLHQCECGKGDQPDLCAWDSELLGMRDFWWQTRMVGQAWWSCSTGNDVECIGWKSLQWFWYDSFGPSIPLGNKPLLALYSSPAPWKGVGVGRGQGSLAHHSHKRLLVGPSIHSASSRLHLNLSTNSDETKNRFF